MSRPAAERPTLAQRIDLAIDGFFARRNLTRPRATWLKKATSRPVVGFALTIGFIAVSIIDPYSGTMASASTIQSFDPYRAEAEQVWGSASTQKISFSRGGFNIVTGDEAAAMYVEAASLPSAGTAKAFAWQQLQAMGEGEDQYSCLVALWERESNWRTGALNRSSGAYGIPQALPGSKMASAGPDWLTNPETQIRWGLKYIESRYGSPCGALAHSDKYNWY